LETSSKEKKTKKQANKLVSDQIYTKKRNYLLQKEQSFVVIHSCTTKKRTWAITGLIISSTY